MMDMSVKLRMPVSFNKEKRIEGKEYIECNGNFGEVTGNAFEINNDYSQFVFKNGVTAAIEQDSAINTIGGEQMRLTMLFFLVIALSTQWCSHRHLAVMTLSRSFPTKPLTKEIKLF